MSTFIDRVADVYLESKAEKEKTEIIFPTRRAALFLHRSIGKRIDKPIWTPPTTTLDQFIKREMNITYLDPLEALFELHRIFDGISRDEISFDRFSKWGRMMLNDFSEIDRYLVDPKVFFSHLEAYKKMDEWLENSFQQDDKLPTAFVQFWQDMGATYFEFRSWCEKNNRFPQGMAFRIFIENLDTHINRWSRENRFFIIAGFNAVSKSEEKLFKSLMDQQLARVLWDYDSFYLDNDIHEAGLFARQIQKWPQYSRSQFKDHVTDLFENARKKITVHAVSGNVAQAKHATQLISKNDTPSDTALILADESLLIPVLMNLPPHLEKVNVTMGYPTAHASSSQFIQQWMNLLYGSTHLTQVGAKSRVYYHVHVNELLSSPLLKYMGLSVETIRQQMAKKNKMVVTNSNLRQWVGQEQGGLIDLLFWAEGEIDTERWLNGAIALIQYIRNNYPNWENSTFWATEMEFLYQHWTFINRFKTLHIQYGNLLSDFSIFRKFYHQQVQSETTDFFGEPLSGLQVMGLLEARSLDFKHIIITSMNEGSLPKNSKNNSLIPNDIKKIYELPTFLERDAVFAHHFYRAITRAEKIDLVYNASEGQNTGELSRFVHQLKYDWKGDFSEITIQTPEAKVGFETFEVPKTEWIMKRLEEWAKNPEKGISVSAIQSYVLNPLEFFNRYVLRIGEELEVEEDIEGKTIGDIVHNTLENVYRDYEREVLTAEALVKIKNSYLHEMNRQFELKEYHPKDLEGQNYLIYQVSKQYIENQIRRDISDAQKAELIYHQGEEELRVQWQQTGSDMYYLQGKIDRIDSHNGKIRILDYKTGSIHLNKHISQDLFSDEKTKFEIQLLWYAYLYLSQNPHLTFEDIDVGLINLRDNAQINEATIKQEDMIRFEEQLREILNEIMNSKIPFKLNRQAKYFNTVAK